ncbi:hypothetical protein [Frondihabitans sp. VKM Ac-2883]|uniref:hypothetical protein n=1 Tax=Frondihabitans sp. VKM Ac-2883 TaxID=2783823 RepID=UPI00188B5EAD|nr:hypothetical protein [Frondihabitans sp. VKM Ac-2883]MBF4575189.1 hypothetical protein [Frondihabitans sp. VKM Ac-2883]
MVCHVAFLDTASDITKIIPRGLPSTAETVLATGGVLDFSGSAAQQSFSVYANGGLRSKTTPKLNTLDVGVSRAVSTQFSGAVTTKTAQQLGLPISSPSKFIYTDVSSATIQKAVAAAVAGGYDSDFVHYFVAPPAPVLPAATYVFFVGLLLGAFLVLYLVIDDQGKRLRGYNTRLVAIGLNRRWSRSILTIQTLVVALGIVAGLIAGRLGIFVISSHYDATTVPVTPAALACFGVIIAAGIATTLASRSGQATGPKAAL